MNRKIKLTEHMTLAILLISLGLTLSYCKKYPEDKFISLRKPETRIQGAWKITEYTLNGNSVISQINSKTITFDIRDLILEINRESRNIVQHYRFSPYEYLLLDGEDNPLTDNSSFRFIGNSNPQSKGDSILAFVFITPLSFQGANYTKWEIKNLYMRKMHLQLKLSSGTYDIYFKK